MPWLHTAWFTTGGASHSLQAFKRNVASAIVNEDNRHFATMNTGNIMDLFQLSVDDHSTRSAAATSAAAAEGVDALGEVKAAPSGQGGRGGRGLAAFLDEMGELWSPEEYADLDISEFVESLDAPTPTARKRRRKT